MVVYKYAAREDGAISWCNPMSLANFATVFQDQAMQRANREVASEHSEKRIYLVDCMVFAKLFVHISTITYHQVCHSFSFATTLGLAAVALTGDPGICANLKPERRSAGLPASAAASRLMGKSGAVPTPYLTFLDAPARVRRDDCRFFDLDLRMSTRYVP